MSKRRVYAKARDAHHDEPGHGSSLNGSDHAELPHPSGDLATTHAGGELAEGETEVAGFLSRLIYTASYSLAYGVVFPALFVAYAVPAENALVRGLIDGGLAARDAVAALHDESAPGEPAPATESAPA